MDKYWHVDGHFLEVTMTEVRFQVDDAFLQNLQQKLGTSKSTDIAREALTLLNWAVKEKSESREKTVAKSRLGYDF